MIKILSYAAAVLVPVFFVGISLKYTTHDYFSNKSVLIAQPILPGAAKAILTLDNGETINLNKRNGRCFTNNRGNEHSDRFNHPELSVGTEYICLSKTCI